MSRKNFNHYVKDGLEKSLNFSKLQVENYLSNIESPSSMCRSLPITTVHNYIFSLLIDTEKLTDDELKNFVVSLINKFNLMKIKKNVYVEYLNESNKNDYNEYNTELEDRLVEITNKAYEELVK